jgi:hypothetical protein
MGMSGPGSAEEEFRAGEGTYWRGRGSMLTTQGGQWSGQLWLQDATNRRKERGMSCRCEDDDIRQSRIK